MGVTVAVGFATAAGAAVSADEPPVEPDETPTLACTPGYWKNHEESWTATGYAPDQTAGDVFDQAALYGLDDETLLESLAGGGGPGPEGAALILLRAASASLLNSTAPDSGFPDSAELITMVNDALASGERHEMLTLADELDDMNNDGACADDEIDEPSDDVEDVTVEVAADVAAGRPAEVPAGPPAFVTQGPPAFVTQGPPAEVPVGPPAEVPVGPPADVPQGPPADVPQGPPAFVTQGPPADVPAGPPADVPQGPPADR